MTTLFTVEYSFSHITGTMCQAVPISFSQPQWLSGLTRSCVHSLWLLVDHRVLSNWDRILVRAVKGLISPAGMVSICPLLWQRDVKLQQTNNKQTILYLSYLHPTSIFLTYFYTIQSYMNYTLPIYFWHKLPLTNNIVRGRIWIPTYVWNNVSHCVMTT